MKYTKLKEEVQKEFDAFPFLFAFSDKQFEEGKKKLGVKNNSELTDIGNGGFMKKTDIKRFEELVEKQHRRLKKFLEDDNQMLEAFTYELANHEYGYNEDYEPTLDCFGLKFEELTEREDRILKQARVRYFKEAADF